MQPRPSTKTTVKFKRVEMSDLFFQPVTFFFRFAGMESNAGAAQDRPARTGYGLTQMRCNYLRFAPCADPKTIDNLVADDFCSAKTGKALVRRFKI